MSILKESGLVKGRKISFQEILNNLMDTEQNIESKTRITKTKDLASLSSFSKFITDCGGTKSGGYLNYFINIYLKYQMSLKGETKNLVAKALSHRIEEELRGGISENLAK